MKVIIEYGAATYRRYRVWLDGDEVTSRCQLADDECGMVQLLAEDAQGQAYLDPDTQQPATVWMYGAVEILSVLA